MHPIRGIYALCDTSQNPGLRHLDLAKQLLDGGISVLQLRMKGDPDLDRVRRIAASIRELKNQYAFTLIINDFVGVARELEVDAVHVGQDDLSVAETRKLVGTKTAIGYSSHSLAEAMAAEAAGADYVALGAIFPTATKGPGHPVVGLETLQKVVAQLQVPVVAIGGIGRGNFASVAQTGVAAIAMISALTKAPNIRKEARWFVEQFGHE